MINGVSDGADAKGREARLNYVRTTRVLTIPVRGIE
jgi:hypothetical protein